MFVFSLPELAKTLVLHKEGEHFRHKDPARRLPCLRESAAGLNFIKLFFQRFKSGVEKTFQCFGHISALYKYTRESFT